VYLFSYINKKEEMAFATSSFLAVNFMACSYLGIIVQEVTVVFLPHTHCPIEVAAD
jgi:hypothetical protein